MHLATVILPDAGLASIGNKPHPLNYSIDPRMHVSCK